MTANSAEQTEPSRRYVGVSPRTPCDRGDLEGETDDDAAPVMLT